MQSRKALEVAFRRWLNQTAPSHQLVAWLRTQDRTAYVTKLGVDGEIDHVVPLSRFDLSDPAQVRLAWSLDNVRRLSNEENKARGACVASAYLALLSTPAIDPTEHANLVAMVEPAFRVAYPRVTLHVEQ